MAAPHMRKAGVKFFQGIWSCGVSNSARFVLLETDVYAPGIFYMFLLLNEFLILK